MPATKNLKRRRQSRPRDLFRLSMRNSKHSKTSAWSLTNATFTLLTIAWCSSLMILVCAQYDGYQNIGYESGGGGQGYEHGMDERPKLKLGIRLRIPAFKFELPPLSLPKITVSAKIRQPDKPRVINLPEINLDTASKVEPPGSKMSGGHGGGASGYESHGSYGGGDYKASSSNYGQPQQERSQTFTFSTGEETHPSYGNNYGNNYGASAHNQNGYQTNMRPMYQTYYKQQMGSYGMMMQRQPQFQHKPMSPASRSRFAMYNRPHGGSYQSENVHGAASTTSYADVTPDKNADIGFNFPVNANPGASSHGRPTIVSQR